MEKKGVSQYRLIKSGVDNRTIDSLKNNRNNQIGYTGGENVKITNCDFYYDALFCFFPCPSIPFHLGKVHVEQSETSEMLDF